MDKWILNIILKIVKPFAKRGIDFEQLTIICQTKIMMDRRRTNSSFKKNNGSGKKNPMLATQLVYGFMGLFLALVIAAKMPLLIGLTSFHGYVFFMLAMTLITDFSSVLLDTTDNQIILPKPVSGETLLMARAIHIFVYLLQFTIALCFFPIIAVVYSYGLVVVLITLFLIPFTVAFTMFLTYLLYAFILKYANEQRLKDIIGYFQIFLTIFFAVGFQIIPRMVDSNLLVNFKFHWYSYLMPAVWMSKATEAIATLNFSAPHVLMIFASTVIPVATVWFLIKYLAPSFSKKLNVLQNANDGQKRKTVSQNKQRSLSSSLSKVFCKSKAESFSFELVWKLTGRDKNFKMQFYPSLAYIPVFIFVFIFKNSSNISDTWTHLSSTNFYLLLIYLPILSIAGSLQIVQYNENFQAAWLYHSSPINQPGNILVGMMKSLWVKFFIPIFGLFFIISIYIWGYRIVDDFILGFINNFLIFSLMVINGEHHLPFSRQPNIKEQSGKFVRMIMLMILIGILVGVHYLALKIAWLPLAIIPVLAIICSLVLKKIQSLQWSKIKI